MIEKNETKTYTAVPGLSKLVNDEMLKDGQFHPNLGGITQGGMANHYPMTIMSMQALGATDEQIVSFRNHWPRHRAHITNDLRLMDDESLTVDNWTLFLGQSRKLKAFRRVFLTQLNGGDKADVITKALEKMKYGLPMGLFHPVIRLSFASMHGDMGLIADALAYMAIRFKDIYRQPQIKSVQSAASAGQTWQTIYETLSVNSVYKLLSVYPSGGSIRIGEQFCGEPGIHQLAFSNNFAVTEQNLELKVAEICQGAVKLYLHQPALTTLHAVTACQALADLTKHYAASPQSRAVYASLWQLYWIWLTSLYIEKGHPAVLPAMNVHNQASVDRFTWHQMTQFALQTGEVHVIKMAFSCQWLFDHVADDGLYQLAVVKMLGQG